MKIYISRKSFDIKAPIDRREYETAAVSVREFIAEMVEKNYRIKPVKDTLESCIVVAQTEFSDGAIYIVNTTADKRYNSLDEEMNLREGDEVMLIKLKYVRGIIW